MFNKERVSKEAQEASCPETDFATRCILLQVVPDLLKSYATVYAYIPQTSPLLTLTH